MGREELQQEYRTPCHCSLAKASDFRVPDANVVLVGNKRDLVASNHSVASEVESQSRAWLGSWIEKSHGRQPRRLSMEDGVSLVSCAPAVLAAWAPFGGVNGWPCDMNSPGLFR